MLKDGRKIMVTALVAIMICTFTVCPVFAESTSKYGFTYNTDYYNVVWKTAESISVYSELGERLGTMTYYVGLARRKNTYDYILMCREVMTPNRKKVSINYDYGNGYGMSEYVSVKTTLPSLGNYKPTNTPKEDEVTLSLGTDSKKVSQISASYTIKCSQLDITSSSDTTKNMYYVKYDYKPSVVNPLNSNKYLANESCQLGEAEFETATDKKTVAFTMKYDVRFGAAANSTRSPLSVFLNYIRKSTGSHSYSLTVSKK